MAALDAQKLTVERVLFLRSLSLSRPNGPEALQIAAAMRDVHFKPGQRLFAAGDPSGDIFFVVRGSVRMTAPAPAVPWDFEAPAVVGALDSFSGRRRTRTGVATSETHALALAHTDWMATLEDHFDFARESVLRLAGALEKMHLGIAGDGGYPEPAPHEGPLARDLGLFERILAMRRLPILRAAGVQATVRLVELAAEIDLAPGEALFREGEACDALDVVAGGVIEVERAAPPLHAAFGPGSLVGGAAAIGVARHPFAARARGAAVVLRVRKDDVFDVMEDHFELTRAILAGVNEERDTLMQRHGVVGERALGGESGRAR